MDIEYVSSNDQINSTFEYNGERYTAPLVQIAILYTENDINNYQVKDTNRAINMIRKTIRNVIDSPDLDDATKVKVIYEGVSFHHSITLKEGIVYGKYGFQADFFKQSSKIAWLIDKQITFVDPLSVLDKLEHTH